MITIITNINTDFGEKEVMLLKYFLILGIPTASFDDKLSNDDAFKLS